MAVVPALTSYVVREGAPVALQVYTASYPSHGSEVIQWTFGPSNTVVVTAGNVVVNGSTVVIAEARVADSGTYQVHFTKNIGGRNETAMTNISLTVQGKHISCLDSSTGK